MCAPFDPPPEANQENQAVNPMAFPPGLIPKLVRDKGRQLMPYSPLGPLEIDRAGGLHLGLQSSESNLLVYFESHSQSH